jgi:hypothetical protein
MVASITRIQFAFIFLMKLAEEEDEKSSPYLTGNTLRLHYKAHPANAV